MTKVEEARAAVDAAFFPNQRDAIFNLITATLETELSLIDGLRKVVDEMKAKGKVVEMRPREEMKP